MCVVAAEPSRSESFVFDLLNDSRGLFFADSPLAVSDLECADGVMDACGDSPVMQCRDCEAGSEGVEIGVAGCCRGGIIAK